MLFLANFNGLDFEIFVLGLKFHYRVSLYYAYSGVDRDKTSDWSNTIFSGRT